MSALGDQLLRRVRDNLTDGASRLARIALDVLAEFAAEEPADSSTQLQQALLAFSEDLRSERPSMIAVHNLVVRWREEVAGFSGDLVALRRHAADQAHAVHRFADAASDATVRAAVQRIPHGSRILTHSSSSTVTEVLRRLAGEGISVIVTESRPGLEGRSLAVTLAELALPVTYITDAQAGLFMDETDLVLLGADSILADGAVVNKAGSKLIALAARDAGIPLFACAESFKCSRLDSSEVELEEKSASELDPPSHDGIRARNIYFDITPAELISEYLSDAHL